MNKQSLQRSLPVSALVTAFDQPTWEAIHAAEPLSQLNWIITSEKLSVDKQSIGLAYLYLHLRKASDRPAREAVSSGAGNLEGCHCHKLRALHIRADQLILQQQMQSIPLQVLQTDHHQQIEQQAGAACWLRMPPLLDCFEDWHLQCASEALSIWRYPNDIMTGVVRKQSS